MNSGTIPLKTGVYISPVVPLAEHDSDTYQFHFNHGLGTPHVRCHWRLVCLQPSEGWRPGDCVDMAGSVWDTANTNALATVWHNDQAAGITVGIAYIYAPPLNSGGTFTPAKPAWGIQVIVEAIAA